MNDTTYHLDRIALHVAELRKIAGKLPEGAQDELEEIADTLTVMLARFAE